MRCARFLQLDEKGQSSVEYALVTFAFVAIAAGLYALAGYFGGGSFVDQVLATLTHRLAAGVVDALAF